MAFLDKHTNYKEFHNRKFFTKKDDESLHNKIVAIKNASKTNCSIHPILVTTYGLSDGMYSGIVQAVITAEDLFAKVKIAKKVRVRFSVI